MRARMSRTALQHRLSKAKPILCRLARWVSLRSTHPAIVMMDLAMRRYIVTIGAAFAALASVVPAYAEKPQDELAAQVRIQGFSCDKAEGTIRDRKRSRPDHAV